MRTIAIDVGVTGALACLDGHGELRYFADLPIAQSGRAKWVDGGRLLTMLFRARENETARVFVERTGPMPQEKGGGMGAANSKGLTLGSVLSIVQVAQLPLQIVAPLTWKRPLGLINPGATDQQRKAASLDLARKLFPGAKLDRQADHNRAEAILIAYWAHEACSCAS